MDGTGTLSQKTSNDGFFELTYNEDGVYLTVHPPTGKGAKVDLNDVLNKLARKRIASFDKEAVAMAVFKSEGIPVKIAEPQSEVKVDAEVSINISPDKMKAFITIAPPEGGRMPNLDELLKLLTDNGIVHGINMTLLDSIVKYPVYNQEICIAEGTPPINGQNGSIVFHFDIKKDRRPAVLEDGRVDYRKLNLIESVSKGQKLCTIIPPTKGIKGKTVTGAEVPALDGKPAPLPKGRNVELSADGQSLVSNIDGQVNLIDGKVSVFPVYEVNSDVGNSTGNINFIGSVSIKGNVLSGFTVEAGGNVEVWGVVEGAFIKAGGNIILKRGMQGLGKGILSSGGDIVARYIEHSNIEAKNDIKAEVIMHSNIKCGNKLELGGRKGLLVGGCCKVGKEIIAKVIGSPMATVTELEVGVDPTIRDRYKEAKDEFNRLEADMKKTEQAIAILKKFEAAGALTPDKQEMLAKSIRTKIFYSNRINQLKGELLEMEIILQQENNGKVRVFNCIYPGTRVSIGTCTMFVKEPLQYCTLYRDGADIRVGPIDK